jgi:hypothetical protein
MVLDWFFSGLWDLAWVFRYPKDGNGGGRICRRHGLHKASRFSGGIT